MGAIKFEKLIRHLIVSYDTNGGGEIEIHYDNATFRPRRSDHRVSPQEAKERRLAKRGESRGLAGCGKVKCAAWLTGLAENIRGGLFVLALGAIGADFPVAGNLGQERKCVEYRLPPIGPRERYESAKYRDIVVLLNPPFKFANESILADRGFTADRSPPYEKRFNVAELRRANVKYFYRFAPSTDR